MKRRHAVMALAVTLAACGGALVGFLYPTSSSAAAGNRVYAIGPVTMPGDSEGEFPYGPWAGVKATVVSGEPADASWHVRIVSSNAADPSDGVSDGIFDPTRPDPVWSGGLTIPTGTDPSGTQYTATFTLWDAGGAQTDTYRLVWIKP